MCANLGPANAARARTHLEEKVAELESRLRYYEQRCQLLEKIIARIDPSLIPSRVVSTQTRLLQQEENVSMEDNDVHGCQESIAEMFFREVQANAARNPHGRRWCEKMTMLCFILRSLGAKAYDYMRQFLALPAKVTLVRHYEGELRLWEASLCDLDCIPMLLASWMGREHALDKPIEVVLGVDAMSMEPIVLAEEEDPHNNVFMFQLLPLRMEYKPLPIHLMTRPSGTAGPTVLQRLHEVSAILGSKGVIVRAIATDGDSSYQSMHEAMFNSWITVFYKNGLDAAVDCVAAYPTPVISDFLHLMKNARSRILNNRVTMCPSWIGSFTAEELNSRLNLGLALTDYTAKGRMRDIYPLEIFNLEHFHTLYDTGDLHMAFYILPYCLWVHAVRNPSISTEMRRQLLNQVVMIFLHHMNSLTSLDTTVVSENKKDNLVQYFCSRKHGMRVCNTVMVLLSEISRNPNNLALDRLGTHVLECTFGLIRILCHNKHTWPTIQRAFARVNLVKDFSLQLCHPIFVRARENVGGVKIASESEGIFVFSGGLGMVQLYQNILLLMLDTVMPLEETLRNEVKKEVHLWVNYIIQFLEECKNRDVKFSRIWHGSSVSNSTILARLISFTRITAEESQSHGISDGSI